MLLRYAFFLLLALAGPAHADDNEGFGFLFSLDFSHHCEENQECGPEAGTPYVTYATVEVVKCGSPAEHAGLKPGDLIATMNNMLVHGINADEFYETLTAFKKRPVMKLAGLRPKGDGYVTFELWLRKTEQSACAEGDPV